MLVWNASTISQSSIPPPIPNPTPHSLHPNHPSPIIHSPHPQSQPPNLPTYHPNSQPPFLTPYQPPPTQSTTPPPPPSRPINPSLRPTCDRPSPNLHAPLRALNTRIHDRGLNMACRRRGVGDGEVDGVIADFVRFLAGTRVIQVTR